MTRDRLADRALELVEPSPATLGQLFVLVRVTALGQFYDYSSDMKRFRAIIYPGAVAEGRVVVRRSPAMQCAAVFAGHVPVYDVPLKGFGVDYRESPLHAPFDEALEQPGGYVEALQTVLGAAWPEERNDPRRGVIVTCRRAF